VGFGKSVAGRRHAQLLPVFVAGSVVPLVLSACSSTPQPQNQATARTAIAVGQTSLGAILVDGMGTSVYLFEKDTGTTSTCYGDCATTWPPVTASGSPSAGTGARASLLGTTTRTGGVMQVTYANHPLYYYSGDNGAGTTAGEGLQSFGGGWDVVSPSGKKVEKGG
jgi:predicted lipoprotein with Yx(FWY)xxD motif